MGQHDPYPDPRLPPWPGFAVAAQAAVQELATDLGLDLWLVTAVQDDQQVVVASAGPWSSLAAPGTSFAWQDSFCLRMTARQGPTVAPDVHEVPAYAAVAVGVLAQVRAYVGVPLEGEDGRMFGTLCAFAGDPQPEGLFQVLPRVQFAAQMLSTLLAREQFARSRSEEAAAAHALAGEDAITGLRNRRSWEAALEHEQERVQRYGSTAAVVLLDVLRAEGDASEEELLTGAAAVLTTVARPVDVLARLGGHEFGVLAVQGTPGGVQALSSRLRVHFRAAGLVTALGGAVRRAGEDLTGTWERADAALARDRARRARLPAPRPGD